MLTHHTHSLCILQAEGQGYASGALHPHTPIPNTLRKKNLTLQASTVYTEHFRVCDAEVSIRENTTTSRFRLTIVSQDGLTIVSQELAETLPTGLASGHNSDFRSPTYVIVIKALTNTSINALTFKVLMKVSAYVKKRLNVAGSDIPP
ncbi:hypothetical protein ASPCAL09811 [Aspergillus calidoustus]|uniref:Uncharacterized protein n=1 Tax=Aspergillus calidoustus TaxID=454130 RepID=A0A0U5GAE7_ASPCI|nr:hypothetical protein ASPCAL09811 [Aspergillus calidoustus]